MHTYKVLCHVLELPYGSIFTTIQHFPYQMGALALFSILGFPDGERLIAGRYHSDDGLEWIQLPGQRIDLSEEIEVDVLGLIVSHDMETCLN